MRLLADFIKGMEILLQSCLYNLGSCGTPASIRPGDFLLSRSLESYPAFRRGFFFLGR